MKENIDHLRPTPRSRLYGAKKMTNIEVPREFGEAIQRISLSIFTDCSNAGRSFQDTLAAIYMSGLSHGAELSKEENHE